MANPITWQNIQTPSQGNPAQFMQLAQTGIDGAFDKLQGVLKQRETTDQANWNQIGVNNAEAFKSALYGMTTPDQMAAAQKSGQFNEMLAGYGANVKDPGALRALMEGRMGVLQKQTTENNLFTDATLDRQQQPERERLTIQALQNAPGAAEAIANSGLRVKSDLVKTVVDRSRQAVTDTQTAAKTASDLLTGTSTRLLQGQQGTALVENAKTAKLVAENRGKTLDAAVEKAKAAAEKNRVKNIVKDTVMAEGTMATSDGHKAFAKLLGEKDLGLNGAQIIDVYANLDKYAPGGMYTVRRKDGSTTQLPVPASFAMQALRGSEENWLANAVPGWSRRGDNFDDRLRLLMENPDNISQIEATQQSLRNALSPSRQRGATGSWGSAGERAAIALKQRQQNSVPSGISLSDVNEEEVRALLKKSLVSEEED